MSDHDEVNGGAESADGEVAEPVEVAATGAGSGGNDTGGNDAGEVVAADVVAAGAAAGALASTVEDDEERRAVGYGWTYLTVLGVIFAAIAFLSFSCDPDEPESTMATTPTTATDSGAADTDTGAEATPVELAFTVADGTVTLTGAVPDEGARRQLVDLATARYGEGNVIDSLTIDENTTLTGGTITTSGTATDGDQNPQGLQSDVAAALGLTESGLDVSFEAAPVVSVDAEAALSAGSVALTGVLPDQASIDSMTAAAEDVWGADNVDASGLTIGDVTWADGVVRVTGSIDAGDTRGDAFATALAAAAPGADIDVSGLTIDTSADALARSEEQLRIALEANPILFALGSSEIDPASDEILAQAAAAINAAPGINVEVVGHTDDQGGEAANESLSAARAEAVVARLVELEVDEERLTARGAGEAEPIADNTTEEGRAANRRIAFEFEGAE